IQLTSQPPTFDTVVQPSHTIQQHQLQLNEALPLNEVLTACGNSNTRQKGCGGSGRRYVLG
ncbi:MAG: hypothetical protein F6K16_32440, partial [Symploca sp. SIO2B6]|nr:hypothetical protein [Symploca sp. SIO2B6]